MERSITIQGPFLAPTTTFQAKTVHRFKAGGKDIMKFGDKPALTLAKADWDSLLMPHRPPAPFTGPINLHINITWPYRKSEPKKRRKYIIPHTTKPDLSNVYKTIEDRLVRLGFIQDDGQVYHTTLIKTWGESPAVYIKIHERDEKELFIAQDRWLPYPEV